MIYDPDKHHRRSIRLKDYDYSQPGAYFITICTANRECILGDIQNDLVVVSQFGKVVEMFWKVLPTHFPHVELDAFVVMPNHIHGVIVLREGMPGIVPYKRHALPVIVNQFKSYSTRRINLLRREQGVSVWQRNFYEHIVRNENEWNAIRQYIHDNPQNWLQDIDHPARWAKGGKHSK